MKNKEMSKSDSCNDWVMLGARLLIVALFAFSVFGKLTGFSGTAGYISSIGISMGLAKALLVGAIILELVGVLTIALGYRMEIGAIALIVFTVVATIMFHNPMKDPSQMIMMLKNISIIGGLLVLSVSKPGRFAVCK